MQLWEKLLDKQISSERKFFIDWEMLSVPENLIGHFPVHSLITLFKLPSLSLKPAQSKITKASKLKKSLSK